MVPVIKTIANNFITDRCPEEVIAVGLNAVREVTSAGQKGGLSEES